MGHKKERKEKEELEEVNVAVGWREREKTQGK